MSNPNFIAMLALINGEPTYIGDLHQAKARLFLKNGNATNTDDGKILLNLGVPTPELTAADFLAWIHFDNVEGAAADSHNGYLSGLRARLEDPANPFRGFPTAGIEVEVIANYEDTSGDGPLFEPGVSCEPTTITLSGRERLRVKHLSPAQREAFGIATDAAEGADVFHFNYAPFDELFPSERSKNVGPMIAVLGALDSVLWQGADMFALRSLIRSLLNPPVGPRGGVFIQVVEKINHFNHIAWALNYLLGQIDAIIAEPLTATPSLTGMVATA